jgi:hypothetical protein
MARITIDTVNVIEMWQGQIQSLASYPDTPQGNADAEQRFRVLASEKARYSEADIEIAIDDGIAEHELGSVILFHSTVS